MNDVNALNSAAWIWCDHSVEPNQYAQFIRDFTFSGTRSTVYIAADMGYALFINGQYVPGFAYSDYPDHRSVDRLDVTSFVREGVNRLCIVGYCQVTHSLTYRSGYPGVRFAVYEDDRPVIVSDLEVLSRRAPDYESGEIEKITVQLGYTFHCDATCDDGWLKVGYMPDDTWHPAVVALTNASLRFRPLQPLAWEPLAAVQVMTWGTFNDIDPADGKLEPAGSRMQRAALSFMGRGSEKGAPAMLPGIFELNMSDPTGWDGLYVVLDMMEETVGLLALDLELPEDATVFIGFGEHLEDLRVRTNVGERQFCGVYRAPAGRHAFAYYFKRFGGRYLQLHIYAKSARLYYAGLRPLLYPVSYLSDYDCGDMLMNKIYQVGMRTLRLCMHEHYEDCPWREQALYAMDSRIQMLCGYYAFHETDMPRESLRLLARGQWDNGLLEMCAPSSFNVTIPSFSLAFIGAVKDYVEYTGDASFAAEMLPVAARILSGILIRCGEDGILADFTEDNIWNFYEWTDGLDGHWSENPPAGRYAPLQAMFVIAAEQYLWLCQCCGAKAFDPALPELIARVRQASGRFWREDRQAFCTCLDASMPDNELVQALVVCAGIANDRQRVIILKKLADPKKNGLRPVTLSYSIFKYDALMSDPERYAGFVRQDLAEIWGRMLFAGATSFWETQRGAWDFGHAGSLCHGWSAVPIYIYHRYAGYMVKWG